MVYRWAQDRLKPIAGDVDRDNLFPHEIWREMGDLGLLGIERLLTPWAKRKAVV